jgi:hypothetical protein
MPKDLRILFLVGGISAFIGITFIIALFLAPSPKSTVVPSPLPVASVLSGVGRDIIINHNYTQPSIPPYTPQNDYSPDYVQKAEEINKSDQGIIRQDQAVGSLLSLLPYKGSYFSMSFDFASADFVVELNKSHLSEANQEFDAFLVKNGVLSRSWIKNMVIKEL